MYHTILNPILNPLRRLLRGWLGEVLLPALALGACLTWHDGRPPLLEGWAAYTALLILAFASLAIMRRYIVRHTPRARSAYTAALAAFLLRLGLGVALMTLLPIYGYQDSEVSLAGYVFKDAFIRDKEARMLAKTDAPIWNAFSGQHKGDQYGGMLALSMALYRYLSPAVHRPFMVLILGALAAAWGVFAMWRAAAAWFGPPTANIAAWIFALYPEAVLLGSSHMREAFVMPALALVFLSLVELCAEQRTWWAWFGAGVGVLLLFQPPAALAALSVAAGLWALDAGRSFTWKRAVLFLGVFLGGLLLAAAVWQNLPSVQGAHFSEQALAWLTNNFGFQSYLSERSSGMLQGLLRTVGERWRLPMVLVYGAAQPVLPATLVDSAALIWRVINSLRAAGWYLLAPLLVYGFVAGLLPGEQPRRRQRLWLNLAVFAWILVAAANAGGDQWDNPRYRAIFLTWQALLAAWAWAWARAHRDPWLGRWLIIMGLFVLLFTHWYLSRQFPVLLHVLSIWQTSGITLGAAFLVLLGGWLRDRKRMKGK